MHVFLMNTAFASSRVDDLMAEDSTGMLDLLSTQKDEIHQYESDDVES